jgi:hypothetical protein
VSELCILLFFPLVSDFSFALSLSWQLRLVSLLAASNPSSVRSAGFQLLHHTFTSSPSFFLAASKQTLTSAQQVLSTPVSKLDPTLFLAATEATKLIVAKSTWYPEWARENVGAQAVQKFVSTLVQAVNESPAIQVSSGVHLRVYQYELEFLSNLHRSNSPRFRPFALSSLSSRPHFVLSPPHSTPFHSPSSATPSLRQRSSKQLRLCSYRSTCSHRKGKKG